MKKKILLLIFSPLLMATQCDDDVCGYSHFEGHRISVENNQETYNINDTIWLSNSISSKLIDFCKSNQDSVIVYDPKIFKEALFFLKLKQENNGLNSENSLNNFIFILDTGQEYNSNSCFNTKELLPTLSNNNLEYNYRIGVIPKLTGDYCITNANDSQFKNDTNRNLSVFENYNTLENQIKFTDCGKTFIRNSESPEIYFFKVQ